MNPYDVDNGIREIRAAITRNDPITRKCLDVALDVTDGFRRQFADRDLRLIGESLITAAASIGVLTNGCTTGTAAINVQAFVGLLLIDADARQSAGRDGRKRVAR